MPPVAPGIDLNCTSNLFGDANPIFAILDAGWQGLENYYFQITMQPSIYIFYNDGFDETSIPEDESDLLDINLKLNAEECKQRDVISFTVIVSEMQNGMEYDRRGVSTVIHIV